MSGGGSLSVKFPSLLPWTQSLRAPCKTAPAPTDGAGGTQLLEAGAKPTAVTRCEAWQAPWTPFMPEQARKLSPCLVAAGCMVHFTGVHYSSEKLKKFKITGYCSTRLPPKMKNVLRTPMSLYSTQS